MYWGTVKPGWKLEVMAILGKSAPSGATTTGREKVITAHSKQSIKSFPLSPPCCNSLFGFGVLLSLHSVVYDDSNTGTLVLGIWT